MNYICRVLGGDLRMKVPLLYIEPPLAYIMRTILCGLWPALLAPILVTISDVRYTIYISKYHDIKFYIMI